MSEKQVEALTITAMFLFFGAMMWGANLIGIARMAP